MVSFLAPPMSVSLPVPPINVPRIAQRISLDPSGLVSSHT